jgi:hypothetical protein
MTHIWTTWLAADPCPPGTDPGWLTQPVATVLAATIAVVGALIAYAGVTKTTRTTRRENRRAEKVAVLGEACAAIHELTRAVDRVATPTDVTVRVERVEDMKDQMRELGDKYSIAATKLVLYGFDAAGAETNSLNEQLSAAWDEVRDDPAKIVNLEECHEGHGKALTAIRQAILNLP